jgi:hypothetical protein
LTEDKNGETNKIICICLLMNQNIRTVPQDTSLNTVTLILNFLAMDENAC